ncbi:hypothetical protein [Mixta sp. Marseille-Q2659]|uniref:hypothetical protein n=1 Tax=Mixta sp. Marseille-Q2659 TaxID=2736607 RepID=UPI0023BA08DF|nr:hypothetical protein [Mixta sp. Marseille-Q2659]
MIRKGFINGAGYEKICGYCFGFISLRRRFGRRLGWSYDQDEMCGTAQKFIQNESDNAVEFDFPYDGGSKMTLVLRSKKSELKKDNRQKICR